MNHDLTVPDPLYFQQASMLVLVFRFRGRRKLVASRLMESSDFEAELAAHAPILDRHYGDLEVTAVDVVSYQHGRYYTDPWPDGAAWLARLREPPATPALEAEGDVVVGDGDADDGDEDPERDENAALA